MKTLTLGSLFDGIGGFPFAAQSLGIRVLWTSEINPTCCDITARHFPNAIQLGDVQKINGAKIPPVDIISFGSPCQDLSVAGQRAGIDGERSGLFMEAVRIIYEMREATNGVYPTYIIWENVPGAYSSHGGDDFRRVLQEIAKAEIPMPKLGKWADSGMVRTDLLGIAWRTFDAKYWGVPQRRKRIYLVGDFGTKCAEEILFKPESLLGYSEEGGKARQGTSPAFEECAYSAGFLSRNGEKARSIGFEEEIAPCLRAEMIPDVIAAFNGQNSITAAGVDFDQDTAPTLRTAVVPSCLMVDLYNGEITGDVAATLTTGSGKPSCSGPKIMYPVVFCKGTKPHNADEPQTWKETDVSHTLNTFDVGENRCNELIVEPTIFDMTHANDVIRDCGDVCPTLQARMGTGGNQVPLVLDKNMNIAYRISSFNSNAMKSDNPQSGIDVTDVSKTLDGNCCNPACNQGGVCIVSAYAIGNGQRDNTGLHEIPGALNCMHDQQAILTIDRAAFNQGANAKYDFEISDKGITSTLVAKGPSAVCYRFRVRRLTPTECERLQGFPDDWTKYRADGSEIKDAPRYTALGNSIAVPCAVRVFKGILDVHGKAGT